MLTIKLTLVNLNKILNRTYVTSFLAIVGVLSGSVPEISMRSPSIVAATIAYAQDYTDEEIVSYARAGYQVELLRQKVYQEIKTALNEPPPNIVCDREQTLDSLSNEVREMAENYCDRSRQIVKNHNLSIDRFNELKQHYDRGDEFYQQVQNVLIDIQNQ